MWILICIYPCCCRTHHLPNVSSTRTHVSSIKASLKQRAPYQSCLVMLFEILRSCAGEARPRQPRSLAPKSLPNSCKKSRGGRRRLDPEICSSAPETSHLKDLRMLKVHRRQCIDGWLGSSRAKQKPCRGLFSLRSGYAHSPSLVMLPNVRWMFLCSHAMRESNNVRL